MENKSTEILLGVPLSLAEGTRQWPKLRVMNPIYTFGTAVFPHVQPPTGSNGRAQTQPSFWRCFKQTHVQLHFLSFGTNGFLEEQHKSCETLIIFIQNQIYKHLNKHLCQATSTQARKQGCSLNAPALGARKSCGHWNWLGFTWVCRIGRSRNHTVSFRGGLYLVSGQRHRSGCCCHQLCNSVRHHPIIVLNMQMQVVH